MHGRERSKSAESTSWKSWHLEVAVSVEEEKQSKIENTPTRKLKGYVGVRGGAAGPLLVNF